MGGSASIQRYKGLGEMNGAVVGNDDGPKFQNITSGDNRYTWKQTEFLSMLMGDEVPPRENLLRKTLFTQILMPNCL
jgi:DNA gyrase subunit B